MTGQNSGSGMPVSVISRVRRVLGGVLLLLACAVLWSSDAAAHAGHHHGPAPTVAVAKPAIAQDHRQAVAAPVEQAAKPCHRPASATVEEAGLMELALAAPADSVLTDGQDCPTGGEGVPCCCAFAHCLSHATGLPASGLLAPPPLARDLPVPASAQALAGVRPAPELRPPLTAA